VATYTKGTFSYPPHVVKAVLDGYGVRTARELAIEHGLKSRHVVVGIWSRARTHGLEMNAPAKSPPGQKKKRLKTQKRMPITPRRIIPEPDPMLQITTPTKQDPRGVRLDRLQSHHCRWPMWGHFDQPSGFFCGAAKINDKPYCLAHCKKAFQNFDPDVPAAKRNRRQA
jgi:hypothetical protein